jgi:hypothetical protein
MFSLTHSAYTVIGFNCLLLHLVGGLLTLLTYYNINLGELIMIINNDRNYFLFTRKQFIKKRNVTKSYYDTVRTCTHCS